MARKGENIYKRKDGRWEGRYIKSRSSTGKANYGYVYAKSYREVKAKLISQSSCTSNSVTVDPEISSDQFEQVAMEWFQAICPKVKESTSNKYRNLLSSYILPVFGSKQLRDITHEFIETQCNFFLVSGGLKENGLSSKTVSDILSLIRNVLQFATRNGKAISCDARSIQIKRQTKEMRVLSRAEQEKLCQYLYSNLDSCNIGILWYFSPVSALTELNTICEWIWCRSTCVPMTASNPSRCSLTNSLAISNASSGVISPGRND